MSLATLKGHIQIDPSLAVYADQINAAIASIYATPAGGAMFENWLTRIGNPSPLTLRFTAETGTSGTGYLDSLFTIYYNPIQTASTAFDGIRITVTVH